MRSVCTRFCPTLIQNQPHPQRGKSRKADKGSHCFTLSLVRGWMSNMAHTSKTSLRGASAPLSHARGWMRTQLLEQGLLGTRVGRKVIHATLIGASPHLETASFFLVAVLVPVRFSVISTVLILKCTEVSGWKGRLGFQTAMLKSRVLLEWHHWRFCCYPWWAPISPAPPATGKQAFVLCGRAAHVFFSFACGHFTVHVSHSGNRMLWLKNDNRHELSHPELSSCLVGILWHPQCPICVSRCLFDMVKRRNPEFTYEFT